MQLCRAVIAALMPPGALWVPETDADLDRLLDGIAENHETARSWLDGLARLRSPYHTPRLADLEREYGILPDPTVAEAIRRARLQVAKTARNGDLQTILQRAGFDVQVHRNDPAVDPGFFLSYAPNAIFGDPSAMLGASSMGSQRGELVVNGPDDTGKYTIPTDAGYWPMFFFVGGAVTRNGSGEITDIADAVVPAARRGELVRLIVRHKPMWAWAGLIARYI
jgi:hypothetical protein